MKNKTQSLAIIFSIFLFLIITPNVSAVSNESIQAEISINKAKQDVYAMIERNITIERVNETLQEALLLFDAQAALEITGKRYNYDLVFQRTEEVNKIKTAAFDALDELLIFRENFKETEKTYDVSEILDNYNAIEKSFTDERFEDTLTLIDEGYSEIARIESEQTAVRLFAKTVGQGLSSFLKENWIQLSIATIIGLIALAIFWKAISRYMVNRKLNYLNLQKSTLYTLIKKIQKDYFEKGVISELEYKTKLEQFKELIRDIDRQIPLLREEIMKLGKKARAEKLLENLAPKTKIKKAISPSPEKMSVKFYKNSDSGKKSNKKSSKKAKKKKRK